MGQPVPIRRGAPLAAAPTPATTDALLRQALAEREAALAVVAGCDALIEDLRRRWRDERPGTFLLPSIEQIKQELGL